MVHILNTQCHIQKNPILQEELYEIEEMKLLQVQEHINLTLRLIKNTPLSKSLPNIQKVSEVTMNNSNRMSYPIKSGFDSDSELIGINQNQEFNRTLPKRLNRAELKLEAARVRLTMSFFLAHNYNQHYVCIFSEVL